MSEIYERIYAVVRAIPRGRVATYGQVAQLAGLGRRARQVGYALFRIAPDADVPWHRVLNARGRVSESPHRLGSDDYQKVLLITEGVEFDGDGVVDLGRFLWHPRSGEAPSDPQHLSGQHGRSEAVVDIHHTDAGGTTIEHRQ
jgi:methylated-DNA-protein-cysteine methyltransferase-like protein